MRGSIIKLMVILFTLLGCQSLYANAVVEVAAQVVKVKAMRINNALTHDHTTEIFADLQNTGNTAHRLVAVYSPVAQQVQLHSTLDHGRKMLQVDSILVSPHKDQDLHFGGLHLMMMGLEKPLASHDEIPVTLIFNDGSWITVDAQVFMAPMAA